MLIDLGKKILEEISKQEIYGDGALNHFENL